MKFKKYFAIISATALMSTLLSLPMLTSAQPTGAPPNNNTPDATFNSVETGGYIAFDQATIDGWMGLFGILSQGPFFGIFGATDAGYGLLGYTNTGTAVVGHSATGTGIGVSARSDGVAFETMDVTTATPSFKINGPTGNLSNPRTGSVLDSPVTITDSDGFVVADDSVGRKFFISGNNGNVYDFDSAVTVTDDDGVAIANTAGTNQLTINGTNGDISDTSGPVTVYDSDGLTVSNLIQNANSGLALARSASGWLRITPNATAGAYNTMVSAGDFLLTYTTGAVETGNLIIGPWSAAAKGIKILANGNVGIGTGNPIYKLQVQGDALGTTSGNTTSLASFSNTNGNGNAINILQKRTANGTDWNTASTRIQQRTDVTDQAYIEFNPISAPHGIAFGTSTTPTERMTIDQTGNVGIGTTAPTQKLHVESGNITAPSGWVGSGYNSQLPTLTTGLTSNAVSALVTSTTGFPTSGKIKIDNEVMSYTGTTANSFTGLTRGSNFTFPAAHAIGAIVSDYEYSAIYANGGGIFSGVTYHDLVWADSFRGKHLIVQNNNAGGITVNADNNNGPDSNANTADDIGGGITINSCADGQYETGYLAPDCPVINGNGGLEINTRTGGVSINTLTGGIVNKDPVIALSGGPTILPGTISQVDCSASGGVDSNGATAGGNCQLPVRISDYLDLNSANGPAGSGGKMFMRLNGLEAGWIKDDLSQISWGYGAINNTFFTNLGVYPKTHPSSTGQLTVDSPNLTLGGAYWRTDGTPKEDFQNIDLVNVVTGNGTPATVTNQLSFRFGTSGEIAYLTNLGSLYLDGVINALGVESFGITNFGSAKLATNTTIDPDAYPSSVVAGAVADGSGFALSTGVGGNSGVGKSWAIGHNGTDLYFGMGDGVANDKLGTYMRFVSNSLVANKHVILVPGGGNSAAGNVGIGTNAPTRKLDVSKASCGAGCELARLAGSSKAITVFGDGWVGINLPSATNPSYNLHVNGSVAGTGAYNALSDIRYKKDLEKISSALSKVLKLNGYVFDWNNEKYPEMNFKEGKDIGFIAQEVEKVVPEIVSKDNGGYMSLAYGSFTPILTEAIKELNTIVENWGTRVVALEKENAELKAKVEGLEERLERLEAMMK